MQPNLTQLTDWADPDPFCGRRDPFMLADLENPEFVRFSGLLVTGPLSRSLGPLSGRLGPSGSRLVPFLPTPRPAQNRSVHARPDPEQSQTVPERGSGVGWPGAPLAGPRPATNGSPEGAAGRDLVVGGPCCP